VSSKNKAQLSSEFVLKKMLPTAAGTKLTALLSNGASKDFGTFSWSPDPSKLYPAAGDLYAFAFLQNASTQEIYQAAVVAIGNDPSVITGLEALTAEDVSVFPNPASKEFTIELPSVTTQKVTYQLVDQVGRVVNAGSISEGQRSTTVNTQDFTSGLYIIQLGGGTSDRVIRKKVVVAHSE
jgi:large repetitive protein